MRPDTPAAHTTEAERLLRTAAQYPGDREPLYLQAAAHRELAGDREGATALYDELLSGEPANPHLIRALKAANLWEYGHEAEARAIIDGIRRTKPSDATAWEITAETLEAHDELEAAESALTEAATLLAGPEDLPHATQSLLITRHRIRRMLARDHDAWDVRADRLHTGTVGLDELHDPKRLWSLGSSDPAELQAEITRLRSELGTYRTALSRPFPVAVLHWPERELDELLAAYPELEAEYPT
ncbi:tetratricopeptide repeat protein, partial [Allokutzneria sp. NRRL B-24872]